MGDVGRAVEALEHGDHVIGAVDEVRALAVVLRAGKDRDEAAEFVVEARPGGDQVGSAVVAGGHRTPDCRHDRPRPLASRCVRAELQVNPRGRRAPDRPVRRPAGAARSPSSRAGELQERLASSATTDGATRRTANSVRAVFMPSTVAAATSPSATSRSIDRRLMKQTPRPASTARLGRLLQARARRRC